MLKFGKYEFCFLDLITEQKPDGTYKVSGQAFWQFVGFSSMTFVFIRAAIVDEIGVDLFVAYGLIVAGSKAADTLIKLKYGGANAITATDIPKE